MLSKKEKIVWREVLFSEIFNRRSKEMEKKMNLYNLYYLYSLVLYVLVVITFPIILVLAGRGCVYDISCVILLSFNIFVVVFVLIIWPTQLWRHGWIVITSEYLIITIGDGKKILKKWSVKDVNKIVINIPKKALEIHLRDRVIKLKRDRRTLKTVFVWYDQSKRFKEAMEKTGIKYEIVYY